MTKISRTLIAGLVVLVVLGGLTVGCGKPLADLEPTDARHISLLSVTPRAGAVGSAVNVRILGKGFHPGATVTMGGAATNVIVVDVGTITATSPIHAAGAVDVVVTNSAGDRGSLAAAFTYAPLEITGVSPVAARSGEPVRILGSGFGAGATVTIGGVTTRVVSADNFSTIDAIAPEHDGGLSDVVVTNPNGRSVTLPGGFTFTTVTIKVSANPVTAGSELTVSWIVPKQNDPPGVRGAEDEFFLVSISTGKIVWGEETTGTSSGSRTLTAPTEPGQYEFRYTDFNDIRQPHVRILGRTTITVLATQSASGAQHY